ncbi:hypothetical protein ACC709_36435, partial [Rhizobium ruizarguesonis]
MKAYFSGRAEALFDVAERHPLAERNLSQLRGEARPEPQHVAYEQATKVDMPPAPLIAIPVDDTPPPNAP